MLSFFSEENYEIHKSYLRTLRLKYSILEKSMDGIKDKKINDIIRQKMKRSDKKDVVDLLWEIVLHEMFFVSFSENTFLMSELVSSIFGSEAAFLNEIFRMAMKIKCGFICVYTTPNNIYLSSSDQLEYLFKYGTPVLSIDISEHAYFLDYGFDKERYLRSALPFLDISKLGVF